MTASNIRITRAFCVELNREVTITEARREYLSLEHPPKRFSFVCSDVHCAGGNVRITGANYWVAADETLKFQTAHFRRLGQHEAGCVWCGEPANVPDSDTDISHGRLARAKLNDLITVFDPNGASNTSGRPGHQTVNEDRRNVTQNTEVQRSSSAQVTVYALGRFERDHDASRVDLVVENLNHLHFVLGPKRTPTSVNSK